MRHLYREIEGVDAAHLKRQNLFVDFPHSVEGLLGE